MDIVVVNNGFACSTLLLGNLFANGSRAECKKALVNALTAWDNRTDVNLNHRRHSYQANGLVGLPSVPVKEAPSNIAERRGGGHFYIQDFSFVIASVNVRSQKEVMDVFDDLGFSTTPTVHNNKNATHIVLRTIPAKELVTKLGMIRGKE